MRDIGAAYPVSETEPPISAEECDASQLAICPAHGGLHVGALYGDRAGDVRLCPIGRQFYRIAARRSGMYERLQFPRGL